MITRTSNIKFLIDYNAWDLGLTPIDLMPFTYPEELNDNIEFAITNLKIAKEMIELAQIFEVTK